MHYLGKEFSSYAYYDKDICLDSYCTQILLEIEIKIGPVSFVDLILGDMRGHQMVLCNVMNKIYQKTCGYWTISAVNIFAVRDSRSNCNVELTAICDVNVVKLTWYMLVYETVNRTLHFRIGTLCRTCVFQAVSDYKKQKIYKFCRYFTW